MYVTEKTTDDDGLDMFGVLCYAYVITPRRIHVILIFSLSFSPSIWLPKLVYVCLLHQFISPLLVAFWLTVYSHTACLFVFQNYFMMMVG